MASDRLFLACGLLFFFLSACEAGSPESALLEPDDNSPSVSDSNSVNRDLSGYLTMVWFDRPWKIDMPSGRFSEFPRVPFDEDSAFHNLADFELSPIVSESSGFMLGIENCYVDELLAFYGCVQFLDRDGHAKKTYYFDYNIAVAEGTFPVSKDGSMFAVISQGLVNRFIAIYSSEGVVLNTEEIRLPHLTDISMEWGVDGLLYYSRQDEPSPRIYYWDPKDSSTSGHFEFEFEGSIGTIRTSPVDRRIAFELINSESSVYMTDLDSGKAWRMVQPDDSFEGQFFSSPVWSPDGEWLLAQHHNEESIAHGLAPYHVVAFPSNSLDLVYDLNDDSPTAVPFEIMDDAAAALGAASQTEWFRGGATYWFSD